MTARLDVTPSVSATLRETRDVLRAKSASLESADRPPGDFRGLQPSPPPSPMAREHDDAERQAASPPARGRRVRGHGDRLPRRDRVLPHATALREAEVRLRHVDARLVQHHDRSRDTRPSLSVDTVRGHQPSFDRRDPAAPGTPSTELRLEPRTLIPIVIVAVIAGAAIVEFVEWWRIHHQAEQIINYHDGKVDVQIVHEIKNGKILVFADKDTVVQIDNADPPLNLTDVAKAAVTGGASAAADKAKEAGKDASVETPDDPPTKKALQAIANGIG